MIPFLIFGVLLSPTEAQLGHTTVSITIKVASLFSQFKKKENLYIPVHEIDFYVSHVLISSLSLSSGHHRLRYNNFFPYLPVFRYPKHRDPSMPWCYLPIFSSVCLPSGSYHSPLQNCLRHTRRSWDVTISLEPPHDKTNKMTFVPSEGNVSRIMTKPTKWVCAQRRLRSAWASAQSDHSLRCPHKETLGPQLPI